MKQELILIPNASSPKNIGDLAILTSLINLLGEKKFKIQGFDPSLFPKSFGNVQESIYSFVAFDNKRTSVRILRLARLAIYYFVFRFKLALALRNILRRDRLFRICEDFDKASTIIFTGGGYLRSRKGITQSANLLMQLFMINFAKLFKKTIIIAPISFGPFAENWQRKTSRKVLRNLDLVYARENISFNLLKKEGVENLVEAVDLALFLKGKKSKRVVGRVGFTIREWLPATKQAQFERSFAEAINQGLPSTVSIQPIVQVDASEFGEDDKKPTARVTSYLQKLGRHVLPLQKIQDVSGAFEIYANIDLLLGMRMHSNILAAACLTPFVGISYEHKTFGIAKTLGMEKYVMNSEEVTAIKLATLIKEAYTKKASLRRNLQMRYGY